MVAKQQLIELERRFREVSKDSAPEPEVRSIWFPAPTISWADLFTLPCAVVLGEAGAGKTSEFYRATEVLRTEGKAAFFLPVEAVAGMGVEKALDLAAARAFRRWRDETDVEVWLLLDSVDESKLRGRPLSSAINAISHELETHLRRVHLIFSSRASDWRSTDEELVVELRPHLAGAAATDDEKFLYSLAPLSGSQVARLAQHHGLQTAEVTTFLQQVRDVNAWVFLERPLDVASMVRYWREYGRLGTHREIVSTDINFKLAERSDRPGVVSVERARTGARKLALAAILTQTPSFQLPDEPIDPNAGKPLVPLEVLRDWSNDEIRALLSRGLFDEATYGRVRIHHREALEFLAAEELLGLVAAGLPRDDLDALLFRSSSGLTVVPAHIQPLIAWFSLEDQQVRQKAIATIPEHLLDQGDPSGLASDARRAALLAYVDQFGKSERVFHGFDPFGLKRFASTQLISTIREILESPLVVEHVQVLLLEIVEHSGIRELGALALALATAEKISPRVRIGAIEAVAKVGSADEREALLGLIERAAIAEKDVAAALMTSLFPEHMPDSSLHKLIQVAPRPPHNKSDRLENLLSNDLASLCSPAQRIGLIEMLAREVSTVSDDGRSYVRKERFWLVECLAALVALEISNPDLPEAARDSALWVLETCLDDAEYHSRHQLEPLHKNDDLRQSYFWRAAEAKARNDRRFPRFARAVRLPHWVGLRREDATWLRVDSLERRHVRERLLAFHALAEVSVPEKGLDDAFWTAMGAVARESDDRHGGRALQTRLDRMRNPRPEPPAEWQVKNRLLHQASERRDKRRHDTWHAQLRVNIERIRQGQAGLGHLYDVCSRDGGTSRSDRVSIDAIAKLYDAEIAEAARKGFMAYWRNTAPEPVEGRTDRTIPGSSFLGLAGLAVEDEAGSEISQLDDPLLRRAVRYAAWELNGFPPWLEKCATLRAELVREVLRPALRQDFDLPDSDPDNIGQVLYKLAYEALATRRACAPELATALLERDPPRLSTLRLVLTTLKDTETVPRDVLIRLARERATASERNASRFAMWWGVLASFEPGEAARLLVAVVARASAPVRLVEEVLARLNDQYDAQKSEGMEPLRGNVSALGLLFELAAQYVRPEDDLVHEGVYSPSARDDAQDMRSRLLNWLAAIKGEDATEELQRLAASAVTDSRAREWLEHLARAHAVADVSKPMSQAEVVTLLHDKVIEPSTTKELFALALNRLRDIQFNLQNADFSVRQVYNPSNDAILEEPVQHFLAKELHEMRRGQYVVGREEEVASKKKTDIRLENARCAGPVTIEVKIAERWDLAELERALTVQLVGQYLRDRDSQYGILLLCSSGPRERWALPDGTVLAFEELTAYLAQRATTIQSETPNVRGLAVVAIDFH